MTIKMRKAFFIVLIIIISILGCQRVPAEQLRDGDIIFQTSRSSQSIAIQRATHSKYSHMGIIFFREGKPYVFEAIKTVQYTPLTKWISRGEGGHFVIKRLRDADRILTQDAVGKLKQAAKRFEGKPYDMTFEWSDDRIYCSELVWKIYYAGLGLNIGQLQRLREFDLTDSIVKTKLQDRYGNNVPLDEIVISPAAIYSSEALVQLMQR